MAADEPEAFDYTAAASRLVQILSPMPLAGLTEAAVFTPYRIDIGPIQIGTEPGTVALTASIRFDALRLPPSNHPDRFVPVHAAVDALDRELAKEVARRLSSASGIKAVCERSKVTWAPIPTPDLTPGEPGDLALSITVRVQSLDRPG